ncbi:ATP-binding protein [Chryseobacterium sp. GMJ5]|uniref:ATP-binding protein n=1 Tax=Chryseobacterium gilvum TaxID=2976534 RepID=A0ABT2VT72_9FLAO|nr:ATP-binding protein [Chryseobacterium gilvum]MCU7613198.1 ATP-binding protein [Chryseobacterium gilvum]
MKIPDKFKDILSKNQIANSVVLDVISSFEPIFKDNKLYFFEEYTDHGIDHIEKVLESAEFIISIDSFKNITATEISILILSIILHDIGMHVELATFKGMLNGDYDKCKNNIIDDKAWSQLWNEYLTEVKRFSSVQKQNIFGDSSIPFLNPNLDNKDNLTGYDKKLIGEFIRRHHCRFAQEVSLGGLKSEKGHVNFGTDKLNVQTKELAGILARSHGMNIRDTFAYLMDIGHDSWRNPHGVNIIYLMVILRIADYIQIDNSRVNPYLLKLKTFNSPISQLENQSHLAVNSINFNNVDEESIYVDCSPNDSKMFVKIKTLIADIQNELDKSWAVLGEVYGFIPQNKPSIKFRRILSNLDNKKFLSKLEYVPKKITFNADNNLSKLLVAPLYGDNPTFGVRELLQNSIDACFERKEIEYQNKNYNYLPKIEISIDRLNDDESIFIIEDNGKGMSSDEIINYFLNVGNSFRKSMEWKKQFVNEDGKTKINRNGKFGIGVLASFLLGKEIKVETKNIYNSEYHFFAATIDAPYININKGNSEDDFGTKISVVINNEDRNKLINPKWDYRDNSIKWTNWYLYDEPKINFSVDQKSVSRENILENIQFFDFSTNDFEKVSWSYDLNIRNRNYSSLIACNGIIITENHSSDYFRYPENYQTSPYGYYQEMLINRKPSLLIVDKEGVFPVKLDRNDIDCDEFPFENDLKIETAKHFIAQLLFREIDTKSFTDPKIIHSPHFLFGTDGFIIDSEYFINGVKDDFQFIRIISDDKQIEVDISGYEDCLFDFKLDTKINLTYQENNVAPHGGGLILLEKNKYESLFQDKVKRLNRYVLDNVNIIDQNQKYVLYTMYDYDYTNPKILTGLNNIDKNLLSRATSIQEITNLSFTKKEGNILNELFKKYIKTHYIIPYEMSKRRELYKEAFKELSYYFTK